MVGAVVVVVVVGACDVVVGAGEEEITISSSAQGEVTQVRKLAGDNTLNLLGREGDADSSLAAQRLPVTDYVWVGIRIERSLPRTCEAHGITRARCEFHRGCKASGYAV